MTNPIKSFDENDSLYAVLDKLLSKYWNLADRGISDDARIDRITYDAIAEAAQKPRAEINAHWTRLDDLLREHIDTLWNKDHYTREEALAKLAVEMQTIAPLAALVNDHHDRLQQPIGQHAIRRCWEATHGTLPPPTPAKPLTMLETLSYVHEIIENPSRPRAPSRIHGVEFEKLGVYGAMVRILQSPNDDAQRWQALAQLDLARPRPLSDGCERERYALHKAVLALDPYFSPNRSDAKNLQSLAQALDRVQPMALQLTQALAESRKSFEAMIANASDSRDQGRW